MRRPRLNLGSLSKLVELGHSQRSMNATILEEIDEEESKRRTAERIAENRLNRSVADLQASIHSIDQIMQSDKRIVAETVAMLNQSIKTHHAQASASLLPIKNFLSNLSIALQSVNASQIRIGQEAKVALSQNSELSERIENVDQAVARVQRNFSNNLQQNNDAFMNALAVFKRRAAKDDEKLGVEINITREDLINLQGNVTEAFHSLATIENESKSMQDSIQAAVLHRALLNASIIARITEHQNLRAEISDIDDTISGFETSQSQLSSRVNVFEGQIFPITLRLNSLESHFDEKMLAIAINFTQTNSDIGALSLRVEDKWRALSNNISEIAVTFQDTHTKQQSIVSMLEWNLTSLVAIVHNVNQSHRRAVDDLTLHVNEKIESLQLNDSGIFERLRIVELFRNDLSALKRELSNATLLNSHHGHQIAFLEDSYANLQRQKRQRERLSNLIFAHNITRKVLAAKADESRVNATLDTLKSELLSAFDNRTQETREMLNNRTLQLSNSISFLESGADVQSTELDAVQVGFQKINASSLKMQRDISSLSQQLNESSLRLQERQDDAERDLQDELAKRDAIIDSLMERVSILEAMSPP